jgi:RNA polymerase sigma factor (sigma-70 family)
MTSTAARQDEVVRVQEPVAELLFRERYAEMVGLAVVLLSDRTAAEDVVQDAYTALFRHEASMTDQQSAAGYLVRSVVNGCRSFQRRKRTAERYAPPAPTSEASAEAAASARRDALRVVEAMQRLPDRQRIAVACHHYLGLDRSETAEVMGISVNSVKTHLRRGIRTLAQQLEEEV